MQKTSRMQPTDTVLVTGGAGYIGAVLCRLLVDQGYSVKVFDAMYFGATSLAGVADKIQIIRGDIREPPPDLFRDVTSVVHLAGLSNDPMAEFNPSANTEINTEATILLGALAKQHHVRRFIFASSCSLYDGSMGTRPVSLKEDTKVNPKTPYPRSKYAAEQGLLRMKDDDFCVTIFRMGTVFGYSPRMRYDLIINTMVRDALSVGALKIFARGLQWRPLIAVGDVVQAYAAALRAPTKSINGQIINIAYKNFMVKDVAKSVQKAFLKYGKTISIRYEQDKKIDRSYKVSIKKAKKILKFSPSTSIESAVQELVSYIHTEKRLRKFEHPIFYNIQWMKEKLSQERDKNRFNL